jgi:UDPglucose 6-dehydrogenase
MVQVVQVTPPVAEMVKISLNAYLHTLISFWNEIYLICEQIGVPSHLVGKLCSQDPRVNAYGAVMHGQPAGGRCLPKDLAQLIEFAGQLDYSPDLLREVQRLNQKVEASAPVVGNSNGHHALEGFSEMLPRTGVVHLGW